MVSNEVGEDGVERKDHGIDIGSLAWEQKESIEVSFVCFCLFLCFK